MKAQLHRFLAATLVTIAGSAHPQLVNDGATSVLRLVTNSFTRDFTVGINVIFTSLAPLNSTATTHRS